MRNFMIFIIGVIFGICLFLTSLNTNAKLTNIEQTSGVCETTGVKWESVYINGNRVYVFSNSSGSDIEVLASY